MDEAIDLQVWLEKDSTKNPAIVAPYIRSAISQSAQYEIHAQQKSAAGIAFINTSGEVELVAERSTQLSNISFSPQPKALCFIEVIINLSKQGRNTYRFDCP